MPFKDIVKNYNFLGILVRYHLFCCLKQEYKQIIWKGLK